MYNVKAQELEEMEKQQSSDKWDWDKVKGEWSTEAQEVLEEILGMVTE